MYHSCFICGVFLAHENGHFHEWCKDIRALCCFEGQLILSGQGHRVRGETPFSVPVLGVTRLFTEPRLDEKDGTCYPFHAACWSIIEEIAPRDFLVDNGIGILFKIFEGCYYNNLTAIPSWGHNYCFEDILEALDKQERSLIQHPIIDCPRVSQGRSRAIPIPQPDPYQKIDIVMLRFRLASCYTSWFSQDPKSLSFKHLESTPSVLDKRPEDEYQAHYQSNLVPSHTDNSTTPAEISPLDLQKDVKFPPGSRLSSLPNEIIHSIMYKLSFSDTLNLLQAYKRNIHSLPTTFWESRFRVQSEFGFARVLCLPNYTWKEWFFGVRSEMSSDHGMGLINRKRIWKLGIEMVSLMQTIQEPGRFLHGDIVTDGPSQRQYSNLCTVIPSYVDILERRLVSGLTFGFRDSQSVNIGYIVGQCNHLVASTSPKILWLVASPLGVEKIAINTYPHSFLDSVDELAVSKWSLENLMGICVGLDALRIVRIWPNIKEQETGLDSVLWTHPYPSTIPSMLGDDIIALHDLQYNSFAPASALHIKPENGTLIAIKVYSPLGFCAGIRGIEFIYNTGIRSTWGSDYDTASLSFFLHDSESLVKIKVYKINSVVYHLQFITNLNRTSEFMSPAPMKSGVYFDCVEYSALDNGCIVGLCGCFIKSEQQLNCFGVISSTTVASLELIWVSSADRDGFGYLSREETLGGSENHGEFGRRLLLDKRLQSIQVSKTTVSTRYCHPKQVTGLLFLSVDSSYPELLGQLTEMGETYHFKIDEWIIDSEIITIKPFVFAGWNHRLSQVKRIIIVTNQRRIELGPEIVKTAHDISKKNSCISEEYQKSLGNLTPCAIAYDGIIEKIE
ncbi:hypothetical protein BHYA_0164g00200 [Botrytis hyacinthi]|uniref:F-box domain-containing protein n=1 Tax=Botrytis hyacinthi TaxID=278943 RepID=A0A4Z1GEB9_9HELO|nr:hypothetical protein BHYA_0164g00200 [Botrytis hyacinthi]